MNTEKGRRGNETHVIGKRLNEETGMNEHTERGA